MSDEIFWQLENKAIKDLKPLEINPRSISKEQFKQLETSIAKFGFIDKPILNQDDTIICGHQRIKVLKKQKIKEIMCWVPSRMLTQEEVTELAIRHNLNHGNWDYDILANNFNVPDLIDWGFTAESLFEDTPVDNPDGEEKQTNKKTIKCPKCGEEFSK